jgi:hypothetical protein
MLTAALTMSTVPPKLNIALLSTMLRNWLPWLSRRQLTAQVVLNALLDVAPFLMLTAALTMSTVPPKLNIALLSTMLRNWLPWLSRRQLTAQVVLNALLDVAPFLMLTAAQIMFIVQRKPNIVLPSTSLRSWLPLQQKNLTTAPEVPNVLLDAVPSQMLIAALTMSTVPPKLNIALLSTMLRNWLPWLSRRQLTAQVVLNALLDVAPFLMLTVALTMSTVPPKLNIVPLSTMLRNWLPWLSRRQLTAQVVPNAQLDVAPFLMLTAALTMSTVPPKLNIVPLSTMLRNWLPWLSKRRPTAQVVPNALLAAVQSLMLTVVQTMLIVPLKLNTALQSLSLRP